MKAHSPRENLSCNEHDGHSTQTVRHTSITANLPLSRKKKHFHAPVMILRQSRRLYGCWPLKGA